jgi:hypothetical protein
LEFVMLDQEPIACPCGAGLIVYRFPDRPMQFTEPEIQCSWCSEVYELLLRLGWDSWQGTYWYWWKPILRS